MSDTVRIEVITVTGYAHAQHIDHIEVPRDEWDAMTTGERLELIHETGMNNISIGGAIVDEDGNLTGEGL